MLLKNTPTEYGAVTKTFHWVMALLVIGMLCLGLYMTGLHDMLEKLKLYNLHKSFGACVLVLVALRICWHAYSKKPAFVESLKAWEKASANAVHFCLYLCMLGMPLSGWLMSSAGGRPVSVFGLFRLPDLIPVNKEWGHFFREIHGTLADALIALICLHVAGALKHHFIDGDRTLRRMLPVLALAFCLALPARAEAAMQWSHLPGSMTYDNGGGTQHVNAFTTDVAFDPQDLENSKISFTAHILFAFVAPKFIAPDARRLMDQMGAAKMPEDDPGVAVFTSESITRSGGADFSMTGTLALNGRSQEISVPFSVIVGKDGATPVMVMKGSFSLDPKDFAGGSLPDPGVEHVPFAFEFHETPAA